MCSANVDGIDPVNFKDYARMALDWLDEGLGLAGDTNRDEIVDDNDLAQVNQWWLNDCN